MVEIPDALPRRLFNATVEERDGAYVIEVPTEAVAHDTIAPGESYRIGLFAQSDPPTTGTNHSQRTSDSPAAAERTERERELERYEAIVENTEDGIYVFDADGYFDFVNQRVADVSGIPRDAWIGEHVSIHTDLGTLTESEVATIEESINAIVRGEADEIRIELTPDIPHDLRVLELRLTSFQPDRETDHVIGFSRDITDQKQYEEELERRNERLGKFASIVSHDLRNPLNVAQGWLDAARAESDSEHLDKVARAHERMQRLVDDLLTLAREGESVPDSEPVTLADAMEACWENVDTAEATLVIDTEQEIRADRRRLQQLLENLIRNAVEHGGDDVTVTIGDMADGFYVADDGPGIPEDERDYVFGVGYSMSEDGTGFGLAIVKETAEAHDWHVSITESDAGGARFEITGVDFV